MRGILALAFFPLLTTTPPAPSLKEITVVATDYAFQAPDQLSAGPTAFKVVNRGKVLHEFNVVLLKPTTTIDKFITELKSGRPVSPLIDGPLGVLFADPGTTSPSQLTANLLPGRDYAIICNFQDNPKASPHFAMGMYKRIHVQGEARAATTSSAGMVGRAGFRVDTIVGSEYAFRYPRTVVKGLHTFLFRNDGTVRHEFNMVLMKKGLSFQSMAALQKAGKDPFSAIENGPGVLTAMPGKSPLGQIDVNLLAGRDYVILCTFSNDDKSPPHFELGMFGTIHVAAH